MKLRTPFLALLACALVTCGAIGVHSITKLTAHVSSLEEILRSLPLGSHTVLQQMPQVHETTWTSGGGALTHTVKTPRNEGEGDSEWAKRHSDAVAALLTQFPADT